MSDLTGKRIPKQTLHGSISTSSSSNPLRGYVLTRGFDGKSAYQYAVDGGYEGTEEEFAEKLKKLMDGEKGVSSWNDLEDKPFYEDEEGNIQQLDEKYIPDTIARKNDIPAINSMELITIEDIDTICGGNPIEELGAVSYEMFNVELERGASIVTEEGV